MNWQTLVSGVAYGSLYATIALGFNITAYVTGLANFAIGEVGMIGAFLTTVLWSSNVPVGVAFVAGLGAAAVVSVVVQVVATLPQRRSSHHSLTWLLAMVGMAVVLRSGAGLLWGDELRRPPELFVDTSPVVIGDVVISKIYLAMIAFVVVAVVATELLFSSAWSTGRALRATASDAEAASLSGISTRGFLVGAFVVGGLITACAMTLAAPILLVSPDMGVHVGLMAVVVGTIGGLGRVGLAPVAAGLLLGLLEAVAVKVAGAGFKDALSLGLLVVVLLARPHGLFGARQVRAV